MMGIVNTVNGEYGYQLEKAILKLGYQIDWDQEQVILSNYKTDALLADCKAAVERMEAVADGIIVEKRSPGVSQATHVHHMAAHLAQHAKIFRAAIAKVEAQ